MTSYLNAQPIRENVLALGDGGELRVTLLHGTGPATGSRCIHRVVMDLAGRPRSDIVYFYDGTVKAADIDADFSALARNGMLSMSQLHHTESMLNRGQRFVR